MHHHALFAELSSLLEASLQILPDKPEESPAGTLEALWAFVAGQALDLEAEAEARLRSLVKRRCEGEPLSYLLGRQTFMGMELLAGPQAMIPRAETEILARAALGILEMIVAQQGEALVLDVCTGSGNVALSLVHHQPRCRAFGGDISEASARFAEENARHLGHSDRFSARAGDFLEPFRTGDFLGKVDLITCNPPYISTGRVDKLPSEILAFEPRAAFDGGPFGIRFLKRLHEEAPAFLRPGGWVACETGLGQGPSMGDLFRKSGRYALVHTHADPEGQVRVITAQLP